MNFSISVDLKALESAINRVNKARVFINKGYPELIKRVAELGGTVSTEIFENAEYDSINDVVVDVVMIDENEWLVTAHGYAVAFIEFGTGYLYNHGYPIQDLSRTGVPATPASWSIGPYGKGHLANKPYWYLPKDIAEKVGKYREPIYGNAPNRAMYEASKEMRDKLLEIAKEVYG